MSAKRILVAVTNDLLTDQRVHKVCLFLHERGNRVQLIGRKRRSSKAMDDRPYSCIRMRLLFERGALFYAFFNLRLFFRMLFTRCDIIVANDLDTLLACRMASKIKGAKLVYDSHEYFTEVPELVHRPRVQKIWEGIERRIFPKLENIITVNQSIADLYEKKYGKKLAVVRNISTSRLKGEKRSRTELGLPLDKKIIIIQGAGINIDRGNEEMVEAMKWIPNAILLIIGDGDVVANLKQTCTQPELQNKVLFFPRMPYSEMMHYTRNADLGITLDKDTNINYRFSLPNKLFDFIHAEIPVFASDLVEVKRIIQHYNIGEITPTHNPEMIASAINQLFADNNRIIQFKANLIKAKAELTWENECLVLEKIYKNIGA